MLGRSKYSNEEHGEEDKGSDQRRRRVGCGEGCGREGGLSVAGKEGAHLEPTSASTFWYLPSPPGTLGAAGGALERGPSGTHCP